MRIPAEIIDVLTRMYERYGFMMQGLDMDTKRDWCMMAAEQINYEYPGQGWGVKRAGNGRPQGKDSIARKRGNNLDIWDLFIGSSGPNPTPAFETADYFNAPDQIFISVQASNHLGGTVVVPPPPPPPPPTGDHEQRIADLEVGEAQHIAEHNELSRLLHELADVMGG